MSIGRENTDIRWVGFHPLLGRDKQPSLFCRCVGGNEKTFCDGRPPGFGVPDEEGAVLILGHQQLLLGLDPLDLAKVPPGIQIIDYFYRLKKFMIQSKVQ